MSVFVSPEDLREQIRTGKKLTVLASLWDAREGNAWSKFQSEHIPTAQFCDPAEHLVGTPGSQVGRNPLPSPERMQESFRAWGIEANRPVVIYDTGAGEYAARTWWTLRWAGVRDVRILDGGFAAWDRLDFETIAGPGPVSVHTELEVAPGQLPTASIEDVKQFKGMLIDARDTSRYVGQRERLDLKSGHIPGARTVPVDTLFTEDGLIKPSEEILEIMAKFGITHNTDPAEAIVYSGSGNHSSKLLAAFEHAGLPLLTHYIGGWSQWSADPENPVERDI
ncbi:sulfurtransferase [Corynebacterium urinipleomorphum]|uniref:sulfurtransferase n=1 Tax=Corynebacterium urinipleomorphum TaxID=1852380 RepID=UPI000B35290E|nr:sulfurtransferase [Corynebacterium urinipleomorphum]